MIVLLVVGACAGCVGGIFVGLWRRLDELDAEAERERDREDA